jgi:hypothetical protein
MAELGQLLAQQRELGMAPRIAASRPGWSWSGDGEEIVSTAGTIPSAQGKKNQTFPPEL